MTASEWEGLKKGDMVLARNGPYEQHGTVEKKWKDGKGMRWVQYHWFRRGNHHVNWASKRYLSLEVEK